MSQDDERPVADEETRILHREITPDPDNPYLAVLEPIAELEGCGVEELPPLYKYVDHLLENLFGTPPPAKSQVEITFTYHNYRVTLDQQGNMRLARLADPLDVP